MKIIDKTITQITVPTPFAVGDTHVYLIKEDTLTLIDAGVKTKDAWDALTVQLKEFGYYPNDIEQIVLTHHHPDHIGLIEQFPRAERLIAHEQVNRWIERDEVFLQEYENFFATHYKIWGIPKKYHYLVKTLEKTMNYAGKGMLTDTIQEGDHIPGHDDWIVIETQGHAQSHVSFLREQDGAFIAGDHLLSHISPNPVLEPPYKRTERAKSLVQYRQNLIKCLDLGIKEVYPGHGEIFSNVELFIPLRLKRQEQRAMKVLQLLQDGPKTPFQLCQLLFPLHYETELNLTMSETIGQLDYLEEEGLVSIHWQDGMMVYDAK